MDRLEDEAKTAAPAKTLDFKFVVVALVILLISLAASFFMMKTMLTSVLPQKAAANTHQKIEAGTLVSAGEFLTNISDPTGARYLKAEIVVEVKKDKKAEKMVNDYMPIIKDNILNILSTATVADLDAGNRELLKQRIKSSLNKALGSELIKNVYFTSFIIQ